MRACSTRVLSKIRQSPGDSRSRSRNSGRASSRAHTRIAAYAASASAGGSRTGSMDLSLYRIPAIRPRGLSEISGCRAVSSVSLSIYPNGTGVPVSTPNDSGSAARSAAAAAKPSTRPVSPPATAPLERASRRQCSSCSVGTGSRYGLSVCGAISRLVKARLSGSGSTRTSNSRP